MVVVGLKWMEVVEVGGGVAGVVFGSYTPRRGLECWFVWLRSSTFSTATAAPTSLPSTQLSLGRWDP